MQPQGDGCKWEGGQDGKEGSVPRRGSRSGSMHPDSANQNEILEHFGLP